AAALTAVSVAAVRNAQRHSYLFVGWFWYVVTLLPVIGIIQVGDQSRADRYTYIPFIGLFVMAAWGIPTLLSRWAPQKSVLAAIALVVIATCAVIARGQVRYWQNDITLWEHTLDVTKNNDLAHANLAIALWEQGKVKESIVHYTEALRIKPTV